MQINATKVIQVEAKTLKVHMKVRDQFHARLVDADGELLKDYDGYVPHFMPGEHFGDYVILDIDIDTGQIVNWRKPTAIDIETFIGDSDDE
jgi:hypothetical protein